MSDSELGDITTTGGGLSVAKYKYVRVEVIEYRG